MTTSVKKIALKAHRSGRYRLPYRRIQVVLPPSERRAIQLEGDGVELRLRPVR